MHEFHCPVVSGNPNRHFSFDQMVPVGEMLGGRVMTTTRQIEIGALMAGQVIRAVSHRAHQIGLKFTYSKGSGLLSAEYCFRVAGDGFKCVEWCWFFDDLIRSNR
jgi:hypothetical protein